MKSIINTFRCTVATMASAMVRLAALLLALLLSTTAASATTFIKDIKLIGGTRAETTELKNSLTAQGWTFIDYDLNKGCGEESDFIYLLYKAEENTDGVNWGYITDFYIREGKEPPSSLTYNGRQYNKAGYDGGEWFVSHYGDLNSNASGNYIYLYYTKALFPDNRAVTSITFNATSDGAVVWNGNGNPADLNSGCGSGSAYIYMHITTDPALAGHQPQSSLEACTAGKYQIAVSGWAYDPDATAQTIGVQVKIYQNDGTTLYRTQNLTANQAIANAGVSGNHGFAATITNIPAGTYKVKLYAIDYNGDGDTQIGATQTVTVTGTQPSGRIDAYTGGVGQFTLSGWAYDPDATAESIGVQVKIYQSNGTTLYKTENLTADRPRNDVNNTFNITGQHGYSATIAIADGGTYKVKVYAIDTNGDGNPQIGGTLTVTVTPGVTLTSETGEVTLNDGDILTGTGGANTHITIASGATVTLNGVNITGITNDGNHWWAGINCAGNATIILADGTTNNVKGGYSDYPGIYAPAGTMLTIRGSGTLNASSNGWGAGIGGGYSRACGNIVIDGGTVTATGGNYAAGIGSAYSSACGDITITANVTSVTATKGYDAPYSIGAGKNGSCGIVTIGGVVTGSIEASPYTFTPADILSVSFDANGGTGTMDSQPFIKGFPQSLHACTFTPPAPTNEMFFNGWNTEADGSGTAYAAGQSITLNENVTLYAQWKSKVIDLSLIPPVIVNGLYAFYELKPNDGDILTGTAGDYVEIRVRDGITVTLRNAHIATTYIVDDGYGDVTYPAIDCLGSATIILEGYNYAKGGMNQPGIYNTGTLTIRGNGALDVVGVIGKGAISGNVAFDGDFIDKSEYYGRHRTILSRNPLLPDAADNGYLLGLYNGQSGINVTLSGRTLYKDGKWNTLCLPFALSAEQVTAQLAPTALMTLSSSAFANGTLTLTFANATTIEAGKPYIIKWASGANIENPVFNGVTVSNATANVETQYVDFIGTTSPTDIYESGTDKHNLFLGSANTLYYPTAEGYKVNSCRAYFRLKQGKDVNNDGAVTMGDVSALVSLILSGSTDTVGDINGDGRASIADVTALANIVRLQNTPITHIQSNVNLDFGGTGINASR